MLTLYAYFERGNVGLPAGITAVSQLQLQEQRQIVHTHAMRCGFGTARQLWQSIQDVPTAWWDENGLHKWSDIAEAEY